MGSQCVECTRNNARLSGGDNLVSRKVNDHESEAATRPSCVFETARPQATSFGLLCGSLSAAMPTPYLERPVEPKAQLAYSGTGTALETA